MTKRRTFLQLTAGLAVVQASPQTPVIQDRDYWVRLLSRIAEPVLTNLANGTLKQNMPVETISPDPADRRRYP